MIGRLRTRVRKQPIIAPYFESENELELYNLAARSLFLSEMIAKLERTLTVTVKFNPYHAKHGYIRL